MGKAVIKMRHVVLISCVLLAAVSAWASPVSKKVQRTDAATEMLANSGFETAADGRAASWAPYDAGHVVEPTGGRAGSACIVCDNHDGKKNLGASQTLRLDRKVARPLVVSGWSKAENVLGSANLDYSVYVDIEYQDGTALWAQVANFTAGTHDWEFQQLRIFPDKPVRAMTVNALFRSRVGKAWFDDLSVKELGGANGAECVVFEGACVEKGDFRSSQPFLQVRDVAAESDFFALPLRDGTAEVPELKLAVSVSSKRLSDTCSRTVVDVKDLTGGDRAIALYYSVPVDATGWRWYDNVRESRVIAPTLEYANTYRPGVGATNRTSRYPFACVAGEEAACSLLVTEPAVCHLGYHAGVRELYAAFDLGLSPDAKRPGLATVTICDAKTDPKWGMRDTARLFYELLPRYFDASRVPGRQGNWMAFQAISSVKQPEDFGFAVHEGNNDVKWDNEHGVQPFVYVEPMTFWMHLPKETPRTYEAVMQFLRSMQNDEKSPHRNIARAVESSCVFDRDGRYHVDILNSPWCDGAVFGNSADPDIASREGWPSLAQHSVTELEKALKSAEPQGGLAGVYLDSLEGWGTLLDFRREHFKAADLPLTFDSSTYRPVILNAFATQEWTDFIADWVHHRGKLLMANAVPNEYPFLAMPCDLLGTETNWQRDGKFAPPATDYLYIKRTLAWKKPYMFLMNTHFESWTSEMTERYMQLCLFYGMFPGFFSENAATNCYFQNPTWYERDRALFRKYMPIIRRVAEAGWEPITLARSDSEDVWVERWGRMPASGLYFTVMNVRDRAVSARITVDRTLQTNGVAECWGGQPHDNGSVVSLVIPSRGVVVIQMK